MGCRFGKLPPPDADINCCAPDASVADVRDHPDLSAFDYIPVKEDGQYLGVLHRAEAAPEGTVKDRMAPLHQRMLVAADMPILEFMDEMGHVPYGLVVEGTRIRGFVTPSDLLKLPVRVSVFALITHLEMVMAELITASLTTDEWLGLLTDGRRAKVQQKRAVKWTPSSRHESGQF